MTSVAAGLLVGAQSQGSQASPQEAPGQSYDDGLYHPGNARLAVVADPPNGLAKTDPKPIDLLGGQGSTEPGMLRATTTTTTTTDTMGDMSAAALKPAALPAEVPVDLRQGHFDPPLQLIASVSTSTTASSSTTSSITSYTLHTTSIPTTTQASSIIASHSSTAAAAAAAPLHSNTMTPGAQAAIVISALSLAIILIGTIFWRLHRRKRALLMAIRGEESPPPTEKPNPIYRFASNLYTSSTSTLVNVSEMFKGSIREKSPPTNVRSSSIYSDNQTQSNPFTPYRPQLWKNRAYYAASHARLASSSAVHLVADKVKSLQGGKKVPDRSSRYSHGYAFAQEFQHVPPPQPTRLQKFIAGLYANGSSTARTVTATFTAKPQPPPKDHVSSTWSSMSSRNPYYETHQDAQQFRPPCDISDDLDLVKVRSVSSGTVAMSNPAEISVDALAGRISGESERPQEAVRESSPSSPSPSQSTTAPSQAPSQRQSPPPEVSRGGSPAYSGRAPSATQLEVPSVKLWTKQVYRVDMDFTSRSDGQLQVGEGQMVLLEQIFDDGWALCTLTDTETQGLLPRACLSTWPIKERRHYASSSNASERTPGSTRDFSPTESQSSRFYRQHSRPGTPKSGTDSKPPSVKKQSISPTLSTFFRP